MKYYVVADVHGFYTELIAALREAGFFDDKEPHKVIFCGDMYDRGKETLLLVEFLLKLMKEDKLIYILGNHEELLISCLQEISRGGVHEIASGMSHHYTNGTWDTLLQIAEMSEYEAYRNPHELVRRVMRSPLYRKLLTVCVDYYETPNYVFVHGWVPCYSEGYRPSVRYKFNPKWRDADVNSWYKARWFNGMELACKHHLTVPGKTVVCGHFHTSYGHAHIEHKSPEWGNGADFSPFCADGIIALDACTAVSGKINCIVIED